MHTVTNVYFLFAPTSFNVYTVRVFVSCLHPLLLKCTLSELLFYVCAYGFQCALSQMCVSSTLRCCFWFASIGFTMHCHKCVFLVFTHCFQCALSQMHVACGHLLLPIRNIRNVCFLFTPIDLHAYGVLSEMYIVNVNYLIEPDLQKYKFFIRTQLPPIDFNSDCQTVKVKF